MPDFICRRSIRAVSPRHSRRLRPTIDGFEPRLLMSGATILGTLYGELNGVGVAIAPVSGAFSDLASPGGGTVARKH